MANRFWVGGAGTWNTSTTNWSATSGGSGGASVPGSSDLVIIDNSSGSGSFTITRTATATIQGIQLNRTSGAVSLAGSSAWTITTAGITIVSSPTVTWDNTGLVTITGTCSLNINGANLQSSVTVNGSGITVTLASTFNTFKTFTLTQGTLALATYTLTCLSFVSGSTGSRTISFGTGSSINLDNSNAGVTIFDTSAASITLSGTPNITIKAYSGLRYLNTGSNVFNLAAITGVADLSAFGLTGAYGSMDLSNCYGFVVTTGMSVTGSLTFRSDVSLTGATGTLTFNGANQTLTTNGATLTFPIAITGTGTFTFGDAFTSTAGITHSGTASAVQGPSSAVAIQALTLTRSGTNTWNTRGGSITLTGTSLSIAAGSTFTSGAAITISGSPTSGTRTVGVANPSSGSPTVALAVSGGTDTLSFGTSVLASASLSGFTGTLTGNLTVYAGVALTGITTTALLLTIYAGAGNTISQTIGAMNTFSCGSGTINLTTTGTLTNLSAVGGVINVSASAALTIGAVTVNSGSITPSATGSIIFTTVTLSGGSLNLTKNIAVTNTLTFNGGALGLNGFTATVSTVNFASTTNDINSISAGVIATNLTVSGTGEYIFNADAAVTGAIIVANGTLRLSGFTASCLTFQQTNGTVAFGVGGAVKARKSLTATGGASTGTGSLFLDGAYTGARSVSGTGFSAGIVLVDAAGSTGVAINATLTSLTTTALTEAVSGTMNLSGVAAFGNHDMSALSIAAISAMGASISVSSSSRYLSSFAVAGSCTCALSSSLKVNDATTLSTGSTLNLAGFTLETGTFAGTTLNGVTCTLAFGSAGTGKLRVKGGIFAVASLPETTGDDGSGNTVTFYGTSGTAVTGTGTIELAGASTNTFDVNIGSYAGVTLNLASAVPSTIATGGAILGNITNSATGMNVMFKGTGAAATKVNSFSLQQCLIGTAVLGVKQDLIFNGSGTTQIYNNLVTGINASPASTWFAQGINGCIDGGNNSGIAFGSAYTGPKTDNPIYIGKRRFYV